MKAVATGDKLAASTTLLGSPRPTLRPFFEFPEGYTADLARRALAEDVGPGDLTADLVPEAPSRARLVCCEPAVFEVLEAGIATHWRAVAETGVDLVSVGAMTKNVVATDFSLLFDDSPTRSRR